MDSQDSGCFRPENGAGRDGAHTLNRPLSRSPSRVRVRARVFAAALLGASALAGAANAQAGAESLEDRVSALENKLDLILQRLDDGASLTSVETVSVKEAAAILSESSGAKVVRPGRADTRSGPDVILVELDTPGGVSAQKETPAGPRDGFTVGDVNVDFSGYLKLDASVTDFSGGELPSSSIGRDFYIPALVPVGGEGDGPDFDFNPRETRFIFDVATERGGLDIGGRLEFDFQVTSDGNERVSNSFTPRMRQAYVTVNNWLLGQAWSTFQDVGALPDNLDFIGPTEGTVFIRQPMIRYTRGPFQIALEQPETEITGAAGERLLAGDDIAPDLVLRYNRKSDWGHLTAAALMRVLHVEDEIVPGAVSDTVFGYGVSLSGKLNVGARDDFRFMATYGAGIGRYIGVNIVNDAAVKLSGELDTIDTFSGFASYRHFWSEKWRSNLTGGYFRADNPMSLVGGAVTDQVYSVHANIIYTIVPKLDAGFEYIFANRRLEDGRDGDMNRFLFSTKYSF